LNYERTYMTDLCVSKIPVIFLHLGEQQYFHSAVKIASRNNPVIVIGNQSEAFKVKYPNITFVDHSLYRDNVEAFEKVYEHMHLSDADMQILCYVRWIIVRNYCIKNNVSRFFYGDSDLAVLSDVTKIFNENINSDFALMTQKNQPLYRWVASAHASYWTIDFLNDFYKYIFDSYTVKEIKDELLKKYNWHKETNRPGGVCDMTQLYLFSCIRPHISLTQVNNKTCFDDNVNGSENYESDEYVVENNMKKIMNKGDKFFFLAKNGEYVQAHAIHCQGGSKQLLNAIARYIEGLK